MNRILHEGYDLVHPEVLNAMDRFCGQRGLLRKGVMRQLWNKRRRHGCQLADSKLLRQLLEKQDVWLLGSPSVPDQALLDKIIANFKSANPANAGSVTERTDKLDDEVDATRSDATLSDLSFDILSDTANTVVSGSSDANPNLNLKFPGDMGEVRKELPELDGLYVGQFPDVPAVPPNWAQRRLGSNECNDTGNFLGGFQVVTFCGLLMLLLLCLYLFVSKRFRKPRTRRSFLVPRYENDPVLPLEELQRELRD